MKRPTPPVLLGELLIIFGIVLLIQAFGLFGTRMELIWSAVFLVSGITFLRMTVRTPDHWWAFIPGFILLSLGVITSLDWIAPSSAEEWSGMVFLWGVSLGFWSISIVRRAWWAIIPGGVLLTLGVITVADQFVADETVGALLFIGIGLTFVLVALAPPNLPRRRWALVPATVCLALAVMVLTETVELLFILWPLVLIGGGLVVLYRSLHPAAHQTKEANDENTPLSQPH